MLDGAGVGVEVVAKVGVAVEIGVAVEVGVAVKTGVGVTDNTDEPHGSVDDGSEGSTAWRPPEDRALEMIAIKRNTATEAMAPARELRLGRRFGRRLVVNMLNMRTWRGNSTFERAEPAKATHPTVCDESCSRRSRADGTDHANHVAARHQIRQNEPPVGPLL
jgi:hypothetical protein